MSTEQKCRVCGCTETNACVKDGVACHWVAPDLCSHCAPTMRMELETLCGNLAHHYRANIHVIIVPPEGLVELVSGVFLKEKEPLSVLLRKIADTIDAGKVYYELPVRQVGPPDP